MSATSSSDERVVSSCRRAASTRRLSIWRAGVSPISSRKMRAKLRELMATRRARVLTENLIARLSATQARTSRRHGAHDPQTRRAHLVCVPEGITHRTHSRPQTEDQRVQNSHTQLHTNYPSRFMRRTGVHRFGVARAGGSCFAATLPARRSRSYELLRARRPIRATSAF